MKKHFFCLLSFLVFASLVPALSETRIACGLTQMTGSQAANEIELAESRQTNVICILVEFFDIPHSKEVDEIQVVLDRMATYWDEVSYGSLKVSSTLVGWYELSREMAYYGGDHGIETDLRIRDLVTEAVSLADQNVDFNLYDYVIIIHSGSGQEVTSLLTVLLTDVSDRIWSCMYDADPNIFTDDGVRIDEVVIVPETEKTLFERYDVLGVFVHEFAHLLGLPDLYDKEEQWGEDTLVGKWSLMSSGAALNDLRSPCHPLAWSKIKLGWVSPRTIDPNETVEILSLLALEENKEEVAVTIPLSSSTYFMVELRVKTGFDRHLPDEGIIITFVDERDPENPRVEVVDANPSTPTKDDAAFKTLNQFNSEGVNILVLDWNENRFDLAVSSKPFPDTDHDELIDLLEERLGTDANSEDTDGDGLSDACELQCGTSPTVSDSDGDKVSDGREYELGTLPTVPDTDGDFWSDGIDPFPIDGRFPNWIFVLLVLFSSPFSLAFLSRRFYGPEHETYKDTILYRGSGIFIIILGLLSGYGAAVLFATKGIHVLPPFSYLVWLLIGIFILVLFVLGFALATEGKGGAHKLARKRRVDIPEMEPSVSPARHPRPEHGFPARTQMRVGGQRFILAVHEENGLTHIHWAFGDPPEITREEYEHLLDRAKARRDAVILVSKLKVDRKIVVVPKELFKED